MKDINKNYTKINFINETNMKCRTFKDLKTCLKFFRTNFFYRRLVKKLISLIKISIFHFINF